MYSFAIRPISFEKEKAIADELLRLLHESEHDFNPRTARWDDIREAYLRHVGECLTENEGLFLIAEVAGVPVGFLFGYLESPEDDDFETGAGDDLYVSEGYVKPKFRKSGVYTALNAAFEAHFKDHEVRRIYRFTLVNNEPMQRWLDRQGYRPVRVMYEKWRR